MQLGFSLGTLLEHHDVLRCASIADSKGAHSIWIPESWAREAFVTLGHLASVTKHTQIGTGIISMYSRSPATIAMAAATLDALCNKRAFIGLGASSKILVENWHGHKFTDHLDRMKNYVEIIRAIMSGEKVNYEGSVSRVKNFKIGFEPVRSNLPIYVAATNEKMLSLSTEVGDGTILFLRPIHELKETVAKLKSTSKNDSFQIICVIITAMARDGALARERAKKTLAFYAAVGSIYRDFLASVGFEDEIIKIRESYKKEGLASIHKSVSDKMLDSIAIAGEPDECMKKLQKFIDTGITLPVIQFNPVNEAESSFKEVTQTFME